MQTCDVLILGGGAIGLSLAYELSGVGLRVQVIDRGMPGRASSWAGAGMIPPAPERPANAWQELAKLADALHPVWAAKLLEQTGIDIEYRRTGAIYLASDASEASWLEQEQRAWEDLGIEHHRIEPNDLAEWEPDAMPHQSGRSPSVIAAFHLPGEAQLRNPRYVRALAAACMKQGVRITAGGEVVDFKARGTRLEGVRLADGELLADRVCLAAGAWSAGLAARLGVSAPVAPVRGQIALLNPGRPVLQRIMNCGPRYLVPRIDGRVLVGSTMEHVGFDTRTTAEGIGGLLEMAGALAPGLAGAEVERCWAGLRPGTPDGLPYLGILPGWDNAYIAAGHFRSGLQLSPATAVVMSELIRGEAPRVALGAFRVDRS